MSRLFVAALLLCAGAGSLLADTRAERELKARLEAEEKKEAALEQVIARLNSGGSAVAVRHASAAAVASANANLDAIRSASEDATQAAAVAREQAEQLRALIERSEKRDNSKYRSTIVIQLTTVTLFAFGFIGTWLVASRDRRWRKADSEDKSEQLREIHTLVNSNMTAAMQSELTALRANLVLLEAEQMRTIVVSSTALENIAAAKVRIAELAARVTDRLAPPPAA